MKTVFNDQFLSDTKKAIILNPSFLFQYNDNFLDYSYVIVSVSERQARFHVSEYSQISKHKLFYILELILSVNERHINISSPTYRPCLVVKSSHCHNNKHSTTALSPSKRLLLFTANKTCLVSFSASRGQFKPHHSLPVFQRLFLEARAPPPQKKSPRSIFEHIVERKYGYRRPRANIFAKSSSRGHKPKPRVRPTPQSRCKNR